MKKLFVLLLAIVVMISCVFISCSKENTEETNPSKVEDAGDEVGFIEQEVTDKNGEIVTDKDGNKLTTLLPVRYDKDKNGNEVINVIDKDGNDTGVTVPPAVTTNQNVKPTTNKADRTTTTAPSATGTTKKDIAPTENEKPTDFDGKDSVPKTTATGKEITFSIEDQEIISSMLEVPYLYTESYENSDGVPISIAAHTAVWMAEREGGTNKIYPSSPIVLNLFKFYGQTVVNFKTNCNSQNTTKAPIMYIGKDDTFEISGFTAKKQTVVITKVEDLGNNNYYKVTGKVSNADGKTRVAAIVQKNRLDSTLGFSIKALKWT